MATIKMTPAMLKDRINESGSHFFDRDTMRFFGDTMSNYGIRAKTVMIKTCYDESGNFTTHEGTEVECYELYRRKPVKYGMQDSAFFDVKTFMWIMVTK